MDAISAEISTCIKLYGDINSIVAYSVRRADVARIIELSYVTGAVYQVDGGAQCCMKLRSREEENWAARNKSSAGPIYADIEPWLKLDTRRGMRVCGRDADARLETKERIETLCPEARNKLAY